MENEERDAQIAIRRICSSEWHQPIPPEIRRALRAQEAREARARIAAEKQRWNTTLLDNVR